MYYDTIICSDPSTLTRKTTTTTKPQTQTDYQYAPDWITGGSGVQSVGDDFTVNSSASTNSTNSTETASTNSKGDFANGCTDGKNDGKLGIGETIGNFLWGAVKAVGNTIKDIATDPVKLVKTVAIGALCVAFPPAGVALGVVGAVSGVVSGAKAISQYASATTDDEAKQALQGMGSSALQIGVSAAGVKGSLGAMKATSGSAMAELASSGTKAGLRATAKAFLKDTVSGGKNLNISAEGISLGSGQGYALTRGISNVAQTGVRETLRQGAKSAGKTIGKALTKETVKEGAKAAAEEGTKASLREGLRAAGKSTLQKGGEAIGKVTTTAFKFNNFAKSAGYKSGFGVLTVPTALAIDDTNKNGATSSNTSANTTTSSYTPGSYKFDLPEEYFA